MDNPYRRKILTFIAGMLVTGNLISGGLVTNTNQSALYTRLQSRNASTSVDAVYFNPAGLGKLYSGFFASVNNQIINQTKKVLNNYPYLAPTPKEYIGKISAPLFPSIYAAVKTGKLAFSVGFNPIGGGGSAVYEDGLPSFEMPISELVPFLNNPATNNIPTTQYSADIYFKGSSVYNGYQANVTYALNEIISVAAGLRLVTAKNTYKGYIRDISINPNYPAFGEYNGDMVLASEFFTSGESAMKLLESKAISYTSDLQSIIDNDYGGLLLSNAETADVLKADQIIEIQNILRAAGKSENQISNATIISALEYLEDSAPDFNAKADVMKKYADDTGDIEADANETGIGYSPILSINISITDMLNIALKYEFKTKLELETKLINGKGGSIFTEGEKRIADIPAMLAAGVEFIPMDKLMVTASANYYFDKDVDYDGSATENVNMIDHNLMEFALGGQYRISDQLRISAGWLGTFTGVNANYQNEQRFSLNTHSFGGGFGFRFMSVLDLSIGGQYTIYKEGIRSFDYISDANPIGVTETYNKNSWIVGIGVDLYLTYENDRRVRYKK
jgi:long-chain fatty acid transport protein